MNLFAQALGVIALCIAIASFQQNSQKKIVTIQMTFLHPFLYAQRYARRHFKRPRHFPGRHFPKSGAAWASNKIWLVLFCVLFTLAGILSWESAISLLPILGMLLTTVAFWIQNPCAVRLVSMPSSPLWFTYNFFYDSYPGMITELFVFSSIVIAIFRYDILPRFRKEN